MPVAERSPSRLSSISSQNGQASLHPFLKFHDRDNSTTPSCFPISRLPPEIRTDIYAHYFASLPPLEATSENGRTPLHQHTSLSLSSPYVKYDILLFTSYANCTFPYKSPKALNQFAGAGETYRIVKVRIEYGKFSRCHHTDWIFLLSKHLET
jgi:hypothetical protein